jgi:RNA polymerase sigma factor (sigma-70 family)
LQITRNEAFRLISRRSATATALPLDAGVELEDERACTAREQMLERVYLGSALERLSSGERLLITLRYEHDCSHPEIAAKLGIPEATARVRLHRAHKRLKSLIDDPG